MKPFTRIAGKPAAAIAVALLAAAGLAACGGSDDHTGSADAGDATDAGARDRRVLRRRIWLSYRQRPTATEPVVDRGDRRDRAGRQRAGIAGLIVAVVPQYGKLELRSSERGSSFFARVP